MRARHSPPFHVPGYLAPGTLVPKAQETQKGSHSLAPRKGAVFGLVFTPQPPYPLSIGEQLSGTPRPSSHVGRHRPGHSIFRATGLQERIAGCGDRAQAEARLAQGLPRFPPTLRNRSLQGYSRKGAALVGCKMLPQAIEAYREGTLRTPACCPPRLIHPHCCGSCLAILLLSFFWPKFELAGPSPAPWLTMAFDRRCLGGGKPGLRLLGFVPFRCQG